MENQLNALFYFSDIYSLRSRDERISKPGAISTPVKNADDIPVSKTVDEAVVERSEKQTPPLPGKYGKTLRYACCL